MTIPAHSTNASVPLPSRPRNAASDHETLRPLLIFAAIALPVGWILLSLPLLLDLPQEPFVLGALLFGMILPAFVLVSRESGGAGIRALLRDAVRLPRPQWLGPVAALTIPVLTWGIAVAVEGGVPMSASLLTTFAVQFLSSLLIINIWEEMVWAGFVQRPVMKRWGVVGGSVFTAALFAGIHLPLAFGDAEGIDDVLLGLVVLIGTAVGLRFLIGRLDGWSGRSLLTVGILHASFNATFELIDPAYDWVRLSITVVLGAACIAIARGPQEASALSE